MSFFNYSPMEKQKFVYNAGPARNKPVGVRGHGLSKIAERHIPAILKLRPQEIAVVDPQTKVTEHLGSAVPAYMQRKFAIKAVPVAAPVVKEAPKAPEPVAVEPAPVVEAPKPKKTRSRSKPKPVEETPAPVEEVPEAKVEEAPAPKVVEEPETPSKDALEDFFNDK